MKTTYTIELHCHTIFSKDSLTRPEKLVAVCREKGIDRVVITDHNTTAGALACQALDPERVIIGEEIQTSQGEILAAFIREEIPPHLTPEETIRRLRDQGAFISVSHPFDIYRNGHWELADLQAITPLVDAIEVFNARCMQAQHNQAAQAYAQTHGLLGTAGSDAHAAFEIGRASMVVPAFQDADSFKAGLASAQIIGKLSSPFVHLTSRYAVWYKKLFSDVQ
ncbi:MAG: PHP-associated domain-containing protein [Anaerolineales bacterium]